MSLRLTIVLGFGLLLAGLSQVVAQDDDGRVAAPAPPPPSAPGQDEFAPGPMTSGEIPLSVQ